MLDTEAAVKEWVQKKYPNGYELYADYNDYLQDGTIRDILEEDDPETAFHEKLFYAYNAYDGIEYEEIADSMLSDMPELEEEDKDTLVEYLREYMDVRYPVDHYLQQKVRVDVFVDTGDADYDFACNCMYPHYNGQREWLKDKDIVEDEYDKASLFWLAQTQGYSREDFIDFLYRNTDNSTFHKDGFLNSVFQELANVPVHMARLVFLQEYTLGELLQIVTCKKDIQIPLGTTCGLYDSWCGGGGPLEIELEKPLTIPHDKVFSILPAHSYSYNIDSCYGLVADAWRPRKTSLTAA